MCHVKLLRCRNDECEWRMIKTFYCKDDKAHLPEVWEIQRHFEKNDDLSEGRYELVTQSVRILSHFRCFFKRFSIDRPKPYELLGSSKEDCKSVDELSVTDAEASLISWTEVLTSC